MIRILQTINKEAAKLKDKLFPVCLFLFFSLLALYRLYNNWHFNPYWGYDGGEHLGYIMSLVKDWRIPKLADNTVAWHEPLYYCLFWPVAKVIYILSGENLHTVMKGLGVAQALLSVAVSWLVYKILRLACSTRALALFIILLISLLPSMNQASTFLTNELLNYFWVFLIVWYFLARFIRQVPTRNNYLWLGLYCGLALLTKVSALVAVLAVVLVLAWRLIRARGAGWQRLVILIVIPLLLYAPWLAFRNRYIMPGLGVNNSVLVPPQPLVLDARLDFFRRFDADILVFPYWYSGGTGLWSMLMADSFYDYYGSIENKDYINYLAAQRSDRLILTSQTPTYVTNSHRQLAGVLVWFAILMSVLTVVGLARLFILALRREAEDYRFYAVLSLGYLAALLYAAYRYPYYDRGILKAIFIFPFYLFPLWSALEMIKKIKILNFLTIGTVGIYLLLLVKYYLIDGFGY